MTPGAPAIVPKYLSGDGMLADDGSVATDAGRKCGSVVASRIRRAYVVSSACWRARDTGTAAKSDIEPPERTRRNCRLAVVRAKPTPSTPLASDRHGRRAGARLATSAARRKRRLEFPGPPPAAGGAALRRRLPAEGQERVAGVAPPHGANRSLDPCAHPSPSF